MPVIGTAGHVDHGKSSLIIALTGRNPDRWEEERRRGLTIDLGFAWTDLDDGTQVSFVDVPGHERFIKNMLAGIEAVDAVLFVVAADDGWMPQSEEHLAVIDALGISRGLVALTKIDRADRELVEMARQDVRDHLLGSTLEGAPIIPVSATEGNGIPQLRTALTEVVSKIPIQTTGRPRIWVDRVFTISGSGTVVTGTLLGAPLRSGDQVAVWPGNKQAWVRGLQVHERSVNEAVPGSRVAVNLRGIDRADIKRGAMLGMPNHWRATSNIAAEIRPARYVDGPLVRGAYQIHVGSGTWSTTLRFVEDGIAYMRLAEPICLQMGDSFILRDSGRRLVVGGGRVLAPDPPPPKVLTSSLSRLIGLVDGTADDRAQALLDLRGSLSVDDLAAQSGGGRPPQHLIAGSMAFSANELERISTLLVTLVADFQQRNPLRPGIPLAEAAERVGLPHHVVSWLTHHSEALVVENSVVRTAGFTVDRSESLEADWLAAKAQLSGGGIGALPRVSELNLPTELLHALIRTGDLVQVSDDLAILPGQVDEILSKIRSLADPFSISDFKDATGLSRKFAIPILEWTDRVGITKRIGDMRTRVG